MNQTCKVCGEPAAGFHFGAFTCEGCKSFFGRSYNNLSSISECKNNGKCVIDKKNRTTCKACRLRKCYTVGMSKGGSRYGRRSNWFKIHCLLQEQQQQAVEAASKAASNGALIASGTNSSAFGDMAAAVAAQQQFSQRNSHLAAAAGAPHLGYPSYIPEMSSAPFMSAAALPFFSMMNSLPTLATNSPTSAFQMPPHLLFPGYHPAAAAAAADAAYRTEMYKHRQSVDSAGSGESQSRFSPANNSLQSLTHDDNQHQMQQQLAYPTTQQQQQPPANRQSPELCVSGDDDEQEVAKSLNSHQPCLPESSAQHQQQQPQQQQQQQQQIPHHHQIHNPIPVRATPPEQQVAPEPSFAAKMQSLSPVSVCSISHETSVLPAPCQDEPMNQDCPMDLSMKTSRSSVNSDSDVLSENSEDQNARRKFYQLETSAESSENSSDSEAIKRQKLNESAYSSFSSHHTQRGIVCV